MHTNIQQAMVGLSFYEAGQAKAAFAAKLARSFPSHREMRDGESVRHEVTVIRTHLRNEVFVKLVSLLKLVKSWSGVSLTLGGTEAPNSSIDRMIAVGECYQRQKRSGNQYHYCNGYDPRHAPTHFGCRRLTSVNRVVPRNGEQHQSANAWYRFGRMHEDDYRVDKPKILAMLRDESEENLACFCPVFSHGAVEREVDAVPDVIVPDGDSRWTRESLPDGSETVRMTAAYSRRGTRRARPDAGDSHATPRNVPPVRYSDVGGQDAAVQSVRDWVELPLRKPEFFQSVGVPIRAGIILHGPPGTGKTLLARAVAGESDAHLEIISGPEILSRWVGQSEENLRLVFDRARQYAPSIVLLDEIDAIAPSRDRATHNHEVTLVSQLLSLMDGIYDRGNVVVIGTTNRLDAIDPALRRPGRFEHSILMEKPDSAGRMAIFRCHLGKMAVAEKVNVRWLAESTDGATGADIAHICREAGLRAIKESVNAGETQPDNVRIETHHLAAALGDAGYTHLYGKR